MRWLLPVVVLISLWANYSIANASSLHVDQFAPLIVRPARLANYSQDPTNLAFPAVDPQLFQQVLQDEALGSAGQSITQPGTPTNVSSASATPSPMGASSTSQPGQATGTPQPGATSPSGGGVLPTTVGAVSTVIGVLPTAISGVEDLTNQILPGAGDIVSGVTDPIIELIPPLPQLPLPEPQPTATSCPKVLGIPLCLP